MRRQLRSRRAAECRAIDATSSHSTFAPALRSRPCDHRYRTNARVDRSASGRDGRGAKRAMRAHEELLRYVEQRSRNLHGGRRLQTFGEVESTRVWSIDPFGRKPLRSVLHQRRPNLVDSRWRYLGLKNSSREAVSRFGCPVGSNQRPIQLRACKNVIIVRTAIFANPTAPPARPASERFTWRFRVLAAQWTRRIKIAILTITPESKAMEAPAHFGGCLCHLPEPLKPAQPTTYPRVAAGGGT